MVLSETIERCRQREDALSEPFLIHLFCLQSDKKNPPKPIIAKTQNIGPDNQPGQ